MDNLRMLGFPTGSIIHFRYDKKWISENVYTEKLENKDVIVIMVYSEKSGEKLIPKFFPLRKGQIVKIETEGSFFHFYFKVSNEFVDYTKREGDYHDIINSLKNKPTEGSEFLQGKFVSWEELHPDIRFSSEILAWEGIVKKISQEISSFSQTVFYKINKLYDTDRKQEVAMEELEELQNGYKLRSGEKYILELSVYDPRKDVSREEPIFKVHTDKEIITTFPIEIMSGFRLDKKRVYLSIKRRLSDMDTFITLFPQSNIDTISISLLFRLGKSIPLLPLFSIFVGLFLTSGIFLPKAWSNISQILGMIITTVGVWFLNEYRK